MWAVGVALAALIGVVAVNIAPPIVQNLTRSVTDGQPITLASSDVVAHVTPPEGWQMARGPAGDSSLDLRSPDGALTVALSVSPSAPAAAFAALQKQLRDDAPDVATAQEEVLASGHQVMHADAAAGAVLAVVDVTGGSVSVMTHVEPGADASLYRASIAALLEQIESA